MLMLAAIVLNGGMVMSAFAIASARASKSFSSASVKPSPRITTSKQVAGGPLLTRVSTPLMKLRGGMVEIILSHQSRLSFTGMYGSGRNRGGMGVGIGSGGGVGVGGPSGFSWYSPIGR